MKRMIECMSESHLNEYFDENGIKNWGDQIDVYIAKSEPIYDLEENKSFDVVFVRCNSGEYTNKEDILVQAEIEEYKDAELLKEKNDRLSKAIDILTDLV